MIDRQSILTAHGPATSDSRRSLGPLENASPLGTPQIPNVTYSHLFPTPFLVHLWAENAQLNQELREQILAHSGQSVGETRTNVGGWHSETGQLEFLGETRGRLIHQMHAMAEEATRRVLVESGSKPQPMQWGLAAWATICRAGDAHMAHTHPGATWSGVYYVDTGASTNTESAPLQLIDPCQGHANTFLPFLLPSAVVINPQAGLMILFPSYVGHTVLAHKGKGARIAIAFNFRKEPFP